MSENLSSHSSYYEEVLNTAAAAMALNKDNDKHDRNNSNSNSNSNNSNNTNGHGNDNSNNNNGAKTNLTGGRKFTTTRIINNHNNNGNNEMNSSFDSNFSANYDNANQNHNYYDNDNDNENGNDEGNKNTNTNTNTNTSIISMTEEDAAMLSSLPKQPIANFPIEADRKRIIGCLAAILAMMFDHEKKGLLNYSPVFDDDDDDDDNNDGNGDKNSDEGSIHLEANNNHNNNFSLEDSIEMEAEESFDESSKSNMSNSTDKQSKRWGGRRGKKNNNINNNNSNSSSNNNNNNNTSNNKNISKNKKLEQEKYKRRRHEVYSSFLIFSAELLFLDKSNAVAFLPLLNSLLGENQPTFNGVKVGVDVGVNSSSTSTLNSNNNTTKSRGVQTKRKNGGKQNDIVQPDDNKEMNTLLRGWDTSPNDKKQQYHQQSNTNANANTNTNHYPHHQSVEFETYIGINDEDKPNEQTWDNNDLLIPFVESLNPGAGFQCLSLLLMNYLLRSQVGYDARIRHILKKLGLVVIAHEMKVSGDYEQKNDDALAKLATRKFEALENSVASKLLKLSNTQQEAAASKEGAADGEVSKTKKSMSMENFVRGLKVGSVGIAAGTLFAVTGGLAAPGIAAGLAASGLTATAAAASIVTTLTSTAAVTTIFGVGGGSLTAYKTHRRIKGLTEFTFNKEGQGKKSKENNEIDGNLFSTICISGWLTDEKDFQRPWGVEPTNPPISDWTEKLMRFYAVYNPDNVSRCNDILKKWKGEERQLWLVLRQKYGRDPDHLYPLQNNLQRSPMSFFENEIVDNLLKELGYALLGEDKEVSNNVGTAGGLVMLKKKTQTYNTNNAFATDTLSTTPNTPLTGTSSSRRAEIAPCHSSNLFESFDERPKYNGEHESTKETNSLAHDIWDFQGEYGGELLTVRWESDLLIELCDSVTDMAVDMVGTAAKEILKQTALSTLITAIAWPYGLVRAASMIDGTWTLAIERSDLAGIELARSLLESKAGHRPVVLVGFSMGARTVYSCLKELARHQQLWEDQQILRKNEKKVRIGLKKKKNKDADAIKYTREPASIVEDAIMMGLPNHLSLHSWENCRSVVAGRLINCYAGRDLILSLMFQIKRLSGALKTVCGTSPVNVAGVENYDVSNFISAHSDYCKMTGRILRMINHGCPYRPSAVITVPNEFGRKYD